MDCPAGPIVGAYLYLKDRAPIHRLVQSNILWERRIGIMSTFHFIKKEDYSDTINIAKVLFEDPHDLIQKAVGWILREMGKRNLPLEEEFLMKYY